MRTERKKFGEVWGEDDGVLEKLCAGPQENCVGASAKRPPRDAANARKVLAPLCTNSTPFQRRLPFRPGIFQAASLHRIPIRPRIAVLPWLSCRRRSVDPTYHHAIRTASVNPGIVTSSKVFSDREPATVSYSWTYTYVHLSLHAWRYILLSRFYLPFYRRIVNQRT